MFTRQYDLPIMSFFHLPWFYLMLHALQGSCSDKHMDLFCLCVSIGACGVSFPHHFHGGGFPEGNSLRPALPPQRLPEERLESARLHHRSCRVSGRKHTEVLRAVKCCFNVTRNDTM